MVMSVLPLAAFSAAAAEDGKCRFVIENNYIHSIDFSGMIRDMSTVNQGRLILTKVTDGAAEEDPWVEFARFDANGAVHFFYVEEGEEFECDVIYLAMVNWQFELCAQKGNLFDDVDVFAFSVADIYETEHRPICPSWYWPDVEISKKDGDLAREITINFNIWKDAPCLPLTLDKTKEVAMIVTAFESAVRLTVNLTPVAYEDGKLTLSVRGSDSTEGLTLHNEYCDIAGTASGYLYRFSFAFPEGLFVYKDGIRSAEFGTGPYTDDIGELPIRHDLTLDVPTTFLRRISKYVPQSLQNAIVVTLLPVVSPFITVYLYRGIWKSLRANGFRFGTIAKDIVRSGGLKDVVRSIYRNLIQ